jgi:hypothetical protein
MMQRRVGRLGVLEEAGEKRHPAFAGATLAGMRLCNILLLVALLGAAGCHPGPVMNAGADNTVGGTIAGIVSTETNAAVPARKVTAVNTVTGTRHDATTGVNGGFTIKVPQGTYRLEIELREGEKVTKQPGETKVNRSDLDPRRDFVISGVRGPGTGL